MTENRESSHWSPEEEINYNIFLIYKADQLLIFRTKPPGFYVEMSRFIPTRSKVQCRSHHEKMLAKFRGLGIREKKDIELLNIRSFFQDHIILRLLDAKHLLKEIEHHLSKKQQQGIVTKEFCCLFKEKAQANLQVLNLDGHSETSVVEPAQVVKEQQQCLAQANTSINLERQHLPLARNASHNAEYYLSYLFDPILDEPFRSLIYLEGESSPEY